jgi:hypothetical protein
MTKGGQFKTVTVAALVVLVWMASEGNAAQCGSTATGFDAWKQQFVNQARGMGVSASTVAALVGRPPIQLQPSRLTVARGASVVPRSVSR